MKLILNSVVFFFLLLDSTIFLYSQERFSVSKNYDIESGLSQSQVNCIVQDRSNLLWIGTQVGLNCFNGYDFIKFFNNPEDTSTLSNNNIRDILIDETDDLWIATHGGCLNKFIKKEKIFKRYHFNPNPASKHVHSVITNLIALDSNTILLGTEQNGLLKFNKRNKTFTSILNFPKIPLRNHVIDLEIVNDSLILVGSEQGLIVLKKQTEEIVNKLLKNDHITSLLFLESQILISDYSGKVYNVSCDELGNKNSILTPILDYVVPVNTLYADKDNIFISADTTTVVFSRKELESNLRLVNICMNNPLKSLRAKIFFEDRSEILWIGTIDKGLYKAPKIHCYFNNIELEYILESSPSVWSVIKDSKGNVWIGADGDGLIQLDRNTGEFKKWINDPHGNNTISSNYISSILEASDGNIWVSTYGGGVNIFDGISFSHLTTESEKYKLSHNRVWQVFEDSKNNMWFATKDGLDCLHRKENRIIHYKHSGEKDCLSNNIILTIFEDSDGLIWIGTYGGGLNEYNPETGKFKSYLSKADDPTTINHGSLRN